MPRIYYVFDSSALVFRYLPSKRPEAQKVQARLGTLFEARARESHRIDFQVPNICMAECSKTFAKACFEQHLYGSGDKARDAYSRLAGTLLKDVSQDRIIHSYELKRDHFKDIENIFQDDYSLSPPKRRAQMLSSNDALIISMAVAIAEDHAGDLDSLKIVTAEERMSRVCNAFPGKYPKTINIRREDPVAP